MSRTKAANCDGRAGARHARGASADVALPVMAADQPKMRASRTSRWRAASLIGVHVLMLAHVGYWFFTGRAVSPVEPSEAMYTLNHGYLNAGFVFFATAILATFIFGRFVCGWGCHFIAYQDFCAWMLKKVGIRPRPFRARFLVLAPLALAFYMFVWPTAYRLWAGAPAPKLSNHLVTTDFWATFPGPVVGILTVVLAGMAIVYFLGSKGFCTYACPYGAFFGVADRFAPGRIRVTDACEGCGHCTATCTSNVRVHEEVASYGMVVDPGCMKCMDCVSVCPNDALYFGFKPIVVREKPRRRPQRTFDFTLTEELVAGGVGVLTLLSLRGLYDLVPLLLAMGLAAISAFVALKLWHLARQGTVRLQNLQLKRGGSWTRTGVAFAIIGCVWLLVIAHSGAVQHAAWRGARLVQGLSIPDAAWQPKYGWLAGADATGRESHAAAVAALQRADRWGLLSTPTVLHNLTWAYVAGNRLEEAELAVRRIVAMQPERGEAHRGLGNVLRKAGRRDEAIVAHRKALSLQPDLFAARHELAAMLLESGGAVEVVALYGDAARAFPARAESRFDYGIALLNGQRVPEAAAELAEATRLAPEQALYHYNLGVATFMMGRPRDAVQHVRRAIDLAPADPMAHGFLAVVLGELGDAEGAQAAAARSEALRDRASHSR